LRSAAFNLLLALAWALFLGEVSLRTLTLGFLIGFVILALFRRSLGATQYIRSVSGALELSSYFLWELVRANLHMALLALRARPRLNPMIVAVPLYLEGDVPLTLLASLTGLLPGTVALGFSPDRRTLYVHAVGTPDSQAARSSVLEVERRLLRMTGTLGSRPPTPPLPRR